MKYFISDLREEIQQIHLEHCAPENKKAMKGKWGIVKMKHEPT